MLLKERLWQEERLAKLRRRLEHARKLTLPGEQLQVAQDSWDVDQAEHTTTVTANDQRGASHHA